MSVSRFICLVGGIFSLAASVLAYDYGTYQNPVRISAPDPSIIYVDGAYHLTYTAVTRIDLTRSRTLGGLLQGETRTIWTDTNQTRSANIFAPEIWHIDDIWYMLYSSCNANQTCCQSCQTRVLRGCDGPNPYDCDYTFLADLVPPVGRQGGKFKNDTFSIDGTYLEIPGKGRYHVLSAYDEDRIQSITITELDTTHWTVSGWNVISHPDQPV